MTKIPKKMEKLWQEILIQRKIIKPLQEWLGRLYKFQNEFLKHFPYQKLPIEYEIQIKTLQDAIAIIRANFAKKIEDGWKSIGVKK